MTEQATWPRAWKPPVEMTAAELDRAGLLRADRDVRISRYAVFFPADGHGARRIVTVESGATIRAFAVVHGGTVLGRNALVEENAVVGQPERGYAVGRVYDGAGGRTVVGDGAVLRAGVVCYAEVCIGTNTAVGHATLLRTGVHVGAETQLGHRLTVERRCRLGREVRCSPGSHLTSATHVGDGAFLGAGIQTINDKRMVWRDPGRGLELAPPRFDTGVKIGSGSVILAGVVVGEYALVGAGSLVSRDIPARALAYGRPARVHGMAP